MPQKGAMTLQYALRVIDAAAGRVLALCQCEMGGSAGCFAHNEATAAYRRLAVVLDHTVQRFTIHAMQPQRQQIQLFERGCLLFLQYTITKIRRSIVSALTQINSPRAAMRSKRN